MRRIASILTSRPVSFALSRVALTARPPAGRCPFVSVSKRGLVASLARSNLGTSIGWLDAIIFTPLYTDLIKRRPLVLLFFINPIHPCYR
jgi:hypothetical protein